MDALSLEWDADLFDSADFVQKIKDTYKVYEHNVGVIGTGEESPATASYENQLKWTKIGDTKVLVMERTEHWFEFMDGPTNPSFWFIDSSCAEAAMMASYKRYGRIPESKEAAKYLSTIPDTAYCFEGKLPSKDEFSPNDAIPNIPYK